MSQEEGKTLVTAMSETPASIVEALICFFAVWSVLGLAGFHSYLAGTNQTTNEEVIPILYKLSCSLELA